MLLVIKKHVSEGLKHINGFFVLLLSMSFGLFIFAYVDQAYIAILGFFFFRMTRQGLDPLYTSIQAREIPSNIKSNCHVNLWSN